MSERGRPYPELDRTISRTWLAIKRHRPHPIADLRLAFRATNRAPAISLTLFTGLTSILLFLLGVATAQEGEPSPLFSWRFLLLLFAGLLVSYIGGGFAALRFLSPEQFAETVISGNSEKEIFRLISYRARRLCMAFIRRTQPIGLLMAELLEMANDPDRLRGDPRRLGEEIRGIVHRHQSKRRLLRRVSLEKTQRRVYKLLLGKDRELRRLEAMKLAASAELGIPPRRFCDQLIQFSPAMFRDGAGKYVQNIKEMIAMKKEFHSHAEIARFCGLVRQNRWLEDSARARVLKLTELIRFRFLYGFLHAFVATRSTSGSLQKYSRALTTGVEPYSLPPPLRRLRTWEKLRFLYRKQRAHPGFELHRLLIRLCKESIRDLDGAAATDARDRVRLQRIAELLERLAEAQPRWDANFPPGPEFDLMLSALERLPAYVSRAVAQARTSINSRFRELMANWAGGVTGRKGHTYLVTYGYSKTVREVIRDAFLEPDSSRDLRLFLLSGDSANDEFDARRMKLEIKQYPHASSIHLAAGHPEFLLGLLSSNDRVILVQGIESYDKELRMVHPRTTGTQLAKLRDHLDLAKIPNLLAVVAESYKRQEQELSQTPLFTLHFERVAIYRADDLIVVGSDGIEPGHWRRIVAERRNDGQIPLYPQAVP